MFWKQKSKNKILYEDEYGITIMNGSIISEIPKEGKREYVATSFMNLKDESKEEKKLQKRKGKNRKRNKIRKKH